MELQELIDFWMDKKIEIEKNIEFLLFQPEMRKKYEYTLRLINETIFKLKQLQTIKNEN